MQCDNGTPFISVGSPGGLSVVSAWLMSLGVNIVRSRLASPQDNGAHERMHRDLASEVEVAPADDLAAQQKALDTWRQVFNHVRPHQALGMKTPAEIYGPNQRREGPRQRFDYREGLVPTRVYANGAFRFRGQQYFLSTPLRNQTVGIEAVAPTKIRIWFRELELCTLDAEPEVDDSVYTSVLDEEDEKRTKAA